MQQMAKVEKSVSASGWLTRLTGYVAAAERWLVKSRRTKIVAGIAASLVVVAWLWPLIFSGGTVAPRPGDSDYFFQAYEAVRRSILTYHQFPWWNAWTGGGVPLFANPQIGVFSLQTLLVLIFGSVLGLKLSVVCYFVLGFWGALVLFRRSFRASYLLSAALAYCWVFNGFYVAHLFDHYTFAFFVVFPWLLYFQLNIRRARYWIYEGLALAALALAALHYAFFQSVFVLGLVGLVQLLVAWRKERRELTALLVRMGGAAGLFLVFAGFRLYYVAQYVLEFPRRVQEPVNHLITILAAWFLPGPRTHFHPVDLLNNLYYGSGEYSVDAGLMVGIAVLAVLIYVAWRSARSKHLSTDAKKYLGCLIVAVGFMIVAIGSFAKLSPYWVIHHLPVYNDMQVSARWLIWGSLFLLASIAYGARVMRSNAAAWALTGLMMLGAVELFALGFGTTDQFGRQPVSYAAASATPTPYANFDVLNYPGDVSKPVSPRPGFTRLYESYEYEATLSNLIEVRGYEPINDTRFDAEGRCGANEGCSLVLSHNATITNWSPDRLVLHRTGPGNVVLDVAPSKYWVLNGQRVDGALNVVAPGTLTITSGADSFVLTIQPRSIGATLLDWLRRRL